MKVTVFLIVVNIAFFAAQLIIPGFTELFFLVPSEALSGSYWQFITHMFLHGDPAHIGWNMLALFIFGGVVEKELGWKRYLFLYMVSGIGSALFYAGLALIGLVPPFVSASGALIPAMEIPSLGASGAIFGVLTSFAFLFPNMPLFILFVPIPIKAKYVVAGFIVFSLFAGLTGIMPGIGHFAHLGGIVVGILFMLYWKRLKKEDKMFRNFDFFWEVR